MNTLRISFNYDPEILRGAGVDLDSGTVARIKQAMLDGLEERVEALRESERGYEDDDSPEWLRVRRELATIEALLAEG